MTDSKSQGESDEPAPEPAAAHDSPEQGSSGAQQGASAVDAEFSAADDSAADDSAEDDDDAVDMSDLDALGVDGVVAKLRGTGEVDDDDDDMIGISRAGRARSPWISMGVIAFSVYLLATMFADFRYWLHAEEPVELGQAEDVLKAEGGLAAYEGRYVSLQGTPDVQNAARLTTKERYVSYLRLTEGEGSLFAAVPRSKAERVYNNFAGRFEGRLRRLGDDRAYAWLEQFFATQKVTRIVDINVQALLDAVGSGGSHLSVTTTTGGSIEVLPDEPLRLVFESPDVRIQLGITSVPQADAAEQQVAALGYPYRRLDSTSTFHRFVARIAADAIPSVQAKLNQQLGVADDNGDPKLGAMVLRNTRTYVVSAGSLTRDGDELRFDYADNTTTPGFVVKEDRLVEVSLPDGMLSLPAAQLAHARLERPITLDPSGYLVAVGEPPSSIRTTGILWLLVLGIALANLTGLVLQWRRRVASAQA